MKEISRRAGKGKFSTSFYKEQCHLVNVEVVRRMMSLFKNKFFFFMMVFYVKKEEDEGKETV